MYRWSDSDTTHIVSYSPGISDEELYGYRKVGELECLLFLELE